MSWTEGLPTHEIISRLMKENEGLRKRNKNVRRAIKQLQRAYDARHASAMRAANAEVYLAKIKAELTAEKDAMQSDRDAALKLARGCHREAMSLRDEAHAAKEILEEETNV